MKLTHGSWILTLTLAGAAAAFTPPCSADQLDAFATDVQVRLVNVDVVVTDRKGRPVPGLGPEDFELLLDGEPVAFTHFAALGGLAAPAEEAAVDVPPASPEAAPARMPPPDQRLSLVIYLDRAYLRPGDATDLVVALRRFLHQEIRPGDRVMLVSADRRAEVIQPFTGLAATIGPRLEEEAAKVGRGTRIESEYRGLIRDIDRTLEGGTDLNARDPEHHTRALLGRIDAFAAESYQDVARSSAQLRQLIAGLSGVPGRKVVLYAGGRMPINAGQTLVSAWRSAFGRNAVRWQTRFGDAGGAIGGGGDAGAGGGDGGEADALANDGIDFDSLGMTSQHLDASQLFTHAGQLASANGIRFYTLDASSLRSSPSDLSKGSPALTGASNGSQWEFDSTQRLQSQAALADLAETTGGRALGGSRDFDAILGDMASDMESVYSLGFEPRNENGDTQRIEVRLEPPHKRLRVRHRRYYQNRNADQEAAESTLSALLFGSSENPLGVELTFTGGKVASEAGGKRRVPLSVIVPLANLALVAEGKAHSGRLSIFFTSGDLDRGAAPMRKAVVPVRLANDEILNVLGRNLEYTLEVEVERGSQTIAVGVRDDFAPLLSTVTLPLASAAVGTQAAGNPP